MSDGLIPGRLGACEHPAENAPATCRRRRGAVLWIVVAAVLSSSCGIVAATKANMNATNDISLSGFSNVKVTYSPSHPTGNQPITLVVVADPAPPSATGSQMSVPQQFQGIELALWTKYPYKFDAVNITIRGDGTQAATYVQLAQSLSTNRPSNLDAQSLYHVVSQGFTDLYIGGGILIALIALFVVMRIVRTRKQRRSKIPPSAGKYGATGGHWGVHHHAGGGGSRKKGWSWS